MSETPDMPSLGESQARLQAARAERDEARERLRDALLWARELEDRLARERRKAGPREREPRGIAALERELASVVASAEEARADLRQRSRFERGLANGLLEATPQTLIEGLSDDLPILLLPVHLETKFVDAAGRRELWVRIYPDDVAVTAHEKTLTVGEADDGRAYWRARAAAHTAPLPVDRQNAARNAWNQLVARHGAHRAAWIARTMRPLNWTDEANDPAELAFPEIVTKPLGSTQAPRSEVLPDRFVVVLVAGSSVREVVATHSIPDDLAFGPDPLGADGVLQRDPVSGRIDVGEDMRWMVDFELAVEAGMALRIPLLPAEANGFDRVLVLGLRTSSSPTDGGARLARLIEAHRYGSGFAIVPQGTPTNNTDAAKSGFSDALRDEADALWPEQDAAPFTPATDHGAKTDGQRLAEALSLPVSEIAELPHARGADASEAMAMNCALWSATLGGFAEDLLQPAMSAADRARTQRYFNAFVLGRGLLPAVRVGEQPYGVLVTSAFQRWKLTAAETGDDLPFWNRLVEQLARLERRWRQLVPEVAFAGKPGDLFANLLAILGLQASSVEFHVRKAIADEYLWNYMQFQHAPAAFAVSWWAQLQSQKAANLARLALTDRALRLRALTFLGASDRLSGPVIDGDPRVPLSEELPIRPFDGKRNYIDWLLESPRADLDGEVFVDGEGKRVPPPAALLYQLLRHAYLAELGHGALRFLDVRAATVFAERPAQRPIANVGPAQTLNDKDLLEVDVARLGVTRAPTAVADYLLQHARATTEPAARPPEAATLADQSAALRVLARLPTARLERCFAEHLDLCGYRVDAWIQGLFAQRLTGLREAGLRRERGGVHLGAYGFVENLRPTTAARRVVPRDRLPAALREDGGDVVEHLDSGGFVHAPSLGQAVTAAVLRNAYLSHADPAHRDTMAVNLASARVRTALGYLEGVRTGQELAALLGYQLERGLHEGHPGVELDEFVYVLRDRFPFVSNKLTPVPDGTAAELVEAANVVNGFDLLEFVRGKTYPYGIAGLPADPARADAIRAEIDRLADAMDAVGDLVLAESVHQVTQGNYDRAKGILQAAGEGGAPPDIEVVTTPRSGRSLTHRVAVHLDPAETAGWNATLTPRARANRPLNHWLSDELPPPADVQWQVRLGAATTFVGLAQLGLEPIDVVLMAKDEVGNGSSELERFLVQEHRRTHAIADDVVTFFGEKTDPAVPDERALVFDLSAAAPGKHSLASMMPLLGTLRRLITTARPLHAADHALPGEAAEMDAANPKGQDDGAPPLQDVRELKDRIEDVHAALDDLIRVELEPFLTATVRPLYAAFRNDPDRVVVPAWSAHLATLRSLLERIHTFGIPEALPAGGLATTAASIDALVPQADSVVTIVKPRLDQARALLDLAFPDPLPADPGKAAQERARRTEQRVASFGDAARALLGRSFLALPLFRFLPSQRAELATAIAAPIVGDRLLVDTWLASLARVRDAMGQLDWLLVYHEWLHATPRALQPIQLPVRAGDRWISSEYGENLGPGDVLSLTLLDPPTDLAVPQCGLLVDEWTELVPAASETTGIAVHCNRPNAVAPQALLLAVAPELRGSWRWTDLVAVVTETFERAKLRAVEPDMIAKTEYSQLLPAVMTEFATGSPLVSTLFAHNVVARAVTPEGG